MLATSISSIPLRRFTPQVAWLLIATAVAWLVTGARALEMDAMSGTMGLGLAAFIPVWTAMMAGMMLPSIMPVASLYARTVRARRNARLALFAAGYVIAWGAVGLPAYGIAWLIQRLTTTSDTAATSAAVAIFAVSGIYQLTPLKLRCLAKCRSTFGLVLQYSGYRGLVREARAGFDHGLYCVSCCWSLMLLLVAFGTMNLWAMVALTAITVLEKTTSRGKLVARVSGIAALVLAALVVWQPSIAPGLRPASAMSEMSGGDAMPEGQVIPNPHVMPRTQSGMADHEGMDMAGMDMANIPGMEMSDGE